MKIFSFALISLFLALPALTISLVKYDPFKINLHTNNFPRDERSKYIFDIIKRAKSRNLNILLDIDILNEGANTFAEIDEALKIANERVKERWIYVKYSDIKYIDSWLRPKGIEYDRDGKKKFIALHYEHMQLLAATTIAFAHREKTGVKINLALIKNRKRQKYVDHKHLLRVVLKKKPYDARGPLFFQ